MQFPGLDNKPWYKQFFPWMLIALPLSSVIAGISTVVIATHDADSLVVGDYYKEGLAINEQHDKELEAKRRGIVANLKWDQRQITLTLPKGIEEKAGVSLMFAHPTKAQKDFVVQLARMPDGIYQGDLPHSIEGRWKLAIQPLSKMWRIREDVHLDVTGQVIATPQT